MKKVVLKLDLHDNKGKQRAMKTVSGLAGIDSIAMDMKDQKLTVTGDIDPVVVVAKLRKLCPTEILTVGPAKEPEKKKEDANKKDEPKKEGGGGGGDKKKDEALGKTYPQPYYQPYAMPVQAYHHQPYYQPYQQPYYQRGAEEDPNSCVIS